MTQITTPIKMNEKELLEEIFSLKKELLETNKALRESLEKNIVYLNIIESMEVERP